MPRDSRYNWIPTKLDEKFFNEFILKYLTRGSRGPESKLSYFKLFNYILYFLHTGCQWENIPIEKDNSGQPEIHYMNVYRTFRRWESDGCFDRIFSASVQTLHDKNMLDTSVIHGDGTTTAAKKGVII